MEKTQSNDLIYVRKLQELVKYLGLKYKYGLCNNYFFVRLKICIAWMVIYESDIVCDGIILTQ